MTEDYGFYAACLRFMAHRTEAVTPEIVAMMQDVAAIAGGVAETGEIVAAEDRLRASARALAGVAGVLDDRCLDASMEAMAALISRAETGTAGETCRLSLPPPPEA